eukprot:776951-Rhodomonas_salina.2
MKHRRQHAQTLRARQHEDTIATAVSPNSEATVKNAIIPGNAGASHYQSISQRAPPFCSCPTASEHPISNIQARGPH